ncbi:MOG interacting and ectopic P-granules protein 1-like [Centruroides vittatus]|uniref:MOG interacting and ectopic P-granules protein 1-like n=1 Tax=Centruroides vittatus TaxID=120091 RepID=UPI00350FE425
MDIESSSDSDDTSSKLQNENSSIAVSNISGKTVDDDLIREKNIESLEIAKSGKSFTNGEDMINGKHLEEKDLSNDKNMEIDDDIMESEQDDDSDKVSDEESKSQEASSSSDDQDDHMSNGFDSASELNDDDKKYSKDKYVMSEKTKNKENVKSSTNNKIDVSHSHMQTRSFSVITKAKQNAKKSLGHSSNAEKSEKSFVLSEVTDDDIEQIRDDSCFPDYLKSLISVGRYIPVQTVNPRDYRPKNNETLIEAPSLTVPLLVKERNIYFDKTYKSERQKHNIHSSQDNYFNSSVGQFLIGLGFSRVREWYHRDMTKIKERQIRKKSKKNQGENDGTNLEEELQEHKSEYLQANEPFMFPMKKCNLSPFQTESHLVLDGHSLIPHISSRREYLCNFCSFNSRDPKLILFHMEAIHNKRGIIDLPVFYECPFCLFDTHLKTKLTSHLSRCQRTFRYSLNQAPSRDFPYPTLTPKPVTTSDVKEYEVSLNNSLKSNQKLLMSQMDGSNRQMLSSMSSLYHQLSSVDYQQLQQLAANNVQLLTSSGGVRTKYPIMNQVHSNQKLPFPITSNHIYHFVNSNGQLVPVLGKDLINSTSRMSFLPSALESSSQKKSQMRGSYDSGNMARVIKIDGKKSIVTMQSSDNKLSSSGHLQRLHLPHSAQGSKFTPQKGSSSGQAKIVICEICDGYIKDLEQLQTHMHWIHKVKIHPKMLASRPPLNCQKCQSRFFTDQGLERHLLGTHGLVTPNMQDMANKNQDGGCCTICGQFYACKLVAHISQVHKITLKPAHLSYKCTVCSATFSLYRQFENHVYSVHSGSGKRSADGDSTQSSKKFAMSSDKGKSKLDLEKSTLSSSNKNDSNKHSGTNNSVYAKEKQGKHNLQPVSTRLKRRKYLRSSEGKFRGKDA